MTKNDTIMKILEMYRKDREWSHVDAIRSVAIVYSVALASLTNQKFSKILEELVKEKGEI